MVIIYGGSFNPPTKAHFQIAKHLINKYKPSQFIFVPVGNNYHKKELAPFKNRVDMLLILTSKLTNTIISEYENTPYFKGTIDLLEHIKSKYNEKVYFVFGADNLIHIDKWINYQDLVKSNNFIVLNRDKINVKQFINNHIFLKNYKDHFIIDSDFDKMNVSSSFYRENNEDHMVLEEINDYIYKNNLYHRGEKDEK